MTQISTCLWFKTNGHLAANFYVTLFPNSFVSDSFKHRDGIPLSTDFVLDGTPYTALNGGPAFTQEAAASINVVLEAQYEIDRLWEALLDGGTAGQGGWLTDRFGLAWHIQPSRWLDIRHSADKTGMRRAFAALNAVQKPDISAMETAFYKIT